MIIRNFWRIYRPVILCGAVMLAVLLASRLFLICLYWQRVMEVDGVGFVLLQGLRFDLILVCALLLVPAMLSPYLCWSRNWIIGLRGYLLLAFVVLLFMESATLPFIQEYDQRPNFLFVEYLKYPQEVFSMLWQGYKVEIFSSILIVGTLSVLFQGFVSRHVHPTDWPGFGTAIIGTVLVLVIGTLGIRSSLGHRPANPSSVAFSQDLLANDLVVSSLYNLSYAIYNNLRYETDLRTYGSLASADVVSQVRDEMALPEQDFISSELPTYHNVSWTSNLDRPPNLVIILEESLGAEFVGSLGGVDVTPELDQLSTQGIWFENLYATGTRSARGIEAVISGFTPTPARSVVKLPRSQREFFTIAALLKNRGYNTSFMYGGEANFDNMRTFFVGNGIDQIIEKKDFANPAFMGSWGICDGELFDRAHAEFVAQGDKPFFSLVFTSSNHSPFEFPEGDFDLHEAPRATVNNAVKYADHALGEFFRKARESDYWDNTLFLVVADHNSRVRGAKLVPVEYFHIPGLILGGSVEPLVVSRLTSQIDLIPTLLGQMGIDDANPATGYDIFRPEMALVPGRAIMQYNGVQAYMQGDRVVIMEMGKVPEVYHYNPELGLQRGSPDLALEKRALAYSIWSTTAYSQQLYRLPASS